MTHFKLQVRFLLHCVFIFLLIYLHISRIKAHPSNFIDSDTKSRANGRNDWKDHDYNDSEKAHKEKEVSKEKPFTFYGNGNKANLLKEFKDDLQDGEETEITSTKEENIMWQSWSSKMDFVKYYQKSGTEGENILSIRKMLFIRQHRRLQKLIEIETKRNNGSASSFTVGINSMAAMTKNERLKLTGFVSVQEENESESHFEVPSKEDEKKNSNNKVTSNLLQIPKKIDWRTKGAVSDVKIQGLCGACWAFASTGMLEGLYYKKYGYLITFSEQELIDCDRTHNLGCNGGNYYYSFSDYYRNRNLGISSGKDHPYIEYNVAQSSLSDKSSTCQKLIKTASLNNSFKVRFVPQSEEAVIEAISRGPVAMALSGYSDIFQFYTGGIIDSPQCGSAVDHAVLAVGYTEDAIIIKNSWGKEWGEDGYARIRRGPGPNGLGYCGIFTQVNEIEYENTPPINCELPANNTNNGDPCKVKESKLFCTSQFGCNSSGVYGNISVTKSNPGLNKQQSVTPTSSPNAVDEQHNRNILIILSSCGIATFLGIVVAVVLFRWKYMKDEDKDKKNNTDLVGKIYMYILFFVNIESLRIYFRLLQAVDFDHLIL